MTVNGDGLLQDVHRSGFYSIRYGFGVPFQGTLTTIIDTDYDDYAVVYSCTNSLLSGVFHSEYIWVLSRSGKISNPTRQNIYEKLDRLQINRSGLTMSDRSTCPTNSSTVARESDKDLAGQNAAASPSIAGSQPSGSSSVESSAQAVSAPASQQVNLEKINPEPTQKSVVVPLLYDLPSPVSSASVGSSAKNKVSSQASPPAPVENKVPQLPLSSSISGSQLKQASVQQQAPKVVSLQQQPAGSVQSSPGSQAAPASSVQQNVVQSVKPQQQVVGQSSAQAQQQAPGLMSKIQQKP